MNAGRRPLAHLLYTNAPGAGGRGFRFLPVLFPGSPEERQAIELWLASLQPADDHQHGWAVHGFSVNRHPCFALALVNQSEFPVDEHDRAGGFLAHALLVLLEEDSPVGDFGLAAFDKARKFLENPSESLDKYLLGCKLATDLTVPELEFNNFRGLNPAFLETFYNVAYDNRGEETVPFPGSTPDELPEHLLCASTALPPRLRLDLSWRVGLTPGKDGFVARSAPGPAPPPAGNPGTAYLDAVRAQLRAGQDDRLARFAAGDWGVRRWSGLQQALVRPEVEESPRIANAGSPAQPEESDMTKKGRATAASKPAAAPRVKSQGGAYGEDYQALEQDLRDYLEQRLVQMGAPSSSSSPPYAGGDLHPALRWYRTWRPEIYFLALLLLGGIAFRKLQQPVAPADPETKPPAASQPKEKTSVVTEPAVSIAPAQPNDWKSFVESPNAAEWLRAVAEHRGLAASQITPQRQAEFNAWADRLGKGEHLKPEELAASRTGFFEYVHARWAKDKDLGKSAENVVSLDPSEAAPHLKDLVKDLGLTGKLGSAPKVSDEKVQATVALAWMKQHPNP